MQAALMVEAASSKHGRPSRLPCGPADRQGGWTAGRLNTRMRPGDDREGVHPMPMLRLTYAELAERTGHNAEAARALARRRRWRIERGNDGKARVLVEEDELAGRPPVHPAGRAEDNGRVNQLLAELTARAERAEHAAEQAQAALLKREVAIARLEELAKAAAELATTQVEAAQQHAAQAVAASEAVQAELRRALEREQARGDRLEAEARRPWWRRLLG